MLLLAAGVDALSRRRAPHAATLTAPPSRRADSMRAGPSQEEIRRQNLGALLRYVHLRGPTSRAELTTELGLNRSTIGALTADLAAAGLVTEEVPRETGRAGRPSLVVRPESERVYAYAFTIEVDRIRGRAGRARRRGARPARDRPARAAIVAGRGRRAAGRVRPGDAAGDAGRRGCVGARRRGLAAWCAARTAWSGSARTSAGSTSRSATRAGQAALRRRPARSPSATTPTWRALAEHTRGVAVGCDNVIYLHGDVGVGGGIIAGGRRVTGHGGYGGEVGHMVVNPAAAPCGCGSRGCWETEIGEYALLRAAGRDGDDGPRGGARRGRRGRRAATRCAQAALRQVGDWLGFGVANLVNIFNPEMVIFGGTLRDVYLASAAQVRSRLNRDGAAGLPRARAAAHADAGRRRRPARRAELAFERLLADPLDAA